MPRSQPHRLGRVLPTDSVEASNRMLLLGYSGAFVALLFMHTHKLTAEVLPPSAHAWSVTAPKDAAQFRKTDEVAISREGVTFPAIAAVPFGYSRISFEAVSPEKVSWCAEFMDDEGEILGDHASSFDPSVGWVHHEFYCRGKLDCSSLRLRFWSGGPMTRIRNLSIETAERKNVLGWAATVYSSMPQFEFRSARTLRRDLPRAAEHLERGGRFRVILLGDSIMNDTGNSPFDVLLEQEYPKSRVELVTSVGNGTGAWHFEVENRVHTYVLERDPDLVVIGGISHRGDIKAVWSVIKQIREYSDVDILLMSGPAGRDGNTRLKKGWSVEIPPGSDEFRSKLQKLAREEQVGFFDAEGAWGNYMLANSFPYEWFMRDPVHANARGRQVLARSLLSYFAK